MSAELTKKQQEMIDEILNEVEVVDIRLPDDLGYDELMPILNLQSRTAISEKMKSLVDSGKWKRLTVRDEARKRNVIVFRKAS